ncbi:hypothetical protein EDD86DRAFT_207855 [Gorgonomyces haynaldii]|nr:hypothetical protein EDD86DRAFT_207855 [Gorgonomyces haynaldii]
METPRLSIRSRTQRMKDFQMRQASLRDKAQETPPIKEEKHSFGVGIKVSDREANKDEMRKKELRAQLLFDYIDKCAETEKQQKLKSLKELAAKKRHDVERKSEYLAKKRDKMLQQEQEMRHLSLKEKHERLISIGRPKPLATVPVQEKHQKGSTSVLGSFDVLKSQKEAPQLPPLSQIETRKYHNSHAYKTQAIEWHKTRNREHQRHEKALKKHKDLFHITWHPNPVQKQKKKSIAVSRTPVQESEPKTGIMNEQELSQFLQKYTGPEGRYLDTQINNQAYTIQKNTRLDQRILMFQMAAKNRERTMTLINHGINQYGMVSSIGKGFEDSVKHARTDKDPLWNPPPVMFEDANHDDPHQARPRLRMDSVFEKPQTADGSAPQSAPISNREKRESVFDLKVGKKLLERRDSSMTPQTPSEPKKEMPMTPIIFEPPQEVQEETQDATKEEPQDENPEIEVYEKVIEAPQLSLDDSSSDSSVSDDAETKKHADEAMRLAEHVLNPALNRRKSNVYSTRSGFVKQRASVISEVASTSDHEEKEQEQEPVVSFEEDLLTVPVPKPVMSRRQSVSSGFNSPLMRAASPEIMVSEEESLESETEEQPVLMPMRKIQWAPIHISAVAETGKVIYASDTVADKQVPAAAEPEKQRYQPQIMKLFTTESQLPQIQERVGSVKSCIRFWKIDDYTAEG